MQQHTIQIFMWAWYPESAKIHQKLVVDFGGFRICPISTLADSDVFRTPAFCVWQNWWILVDSGYFLVKIPKGLGLKEQVVDKGIRQKSTKQSKEWTHSLMAVPFVRGNRIVSPRAPRNIWMYTRHPAQCHGHMWHVDTAPAQTRKKQNAC